MLTTGLAGVGKEKTNTWRSASVTWRNASGKAPASHEGRRRVGTIESQRPSHQNHYPTHMPKSLVHLAVALVSIATAPAWGQTFQSIYSFPADGTQGTTPKATLTVGPEGSLYGTASAGGSGNAGTAFKISTAGTFSPLGSFVPADTGKAPVARLVNIGDGFLYGVTSEGTGTAGDPLGTVFKLDPAGGLSKVFAVPGSGTTPMRPHALVSGEPNTLHVLGNSPGGIWRVPLDGGTATPVFTLTNSDDGIFPESLIRGTDGFLYGVTSGTSFVDTTPGRQGTIFKIAPSGADFAKIHDCDLATGVAPYGAMVQGPDGSFYGTMSAGGQNSDGVIFRLQSNGSGYTVLHDINDHPTKADLLLASDGRLYGTSKSGGANLAGSIFRINPDGSGFQVIHTFNTANGAGPEAGLVQAADGNLYGVTTVGGDHGKGTIFRIDLNLPTPEVNRRPLAINDNAFSSGSAVVVSVLANDFDPDDDPLTVTLESLPVHGTATVETNGTITYAPTGGNYAGFDEFQYRITDPEGLSATATVTITDDAIPPVFQPTAYNGILNLDPSLSGNTDIPRGQLIINIAASGIFTGKLFSQGKRYPVRGAFDDGGTAVAVVKFSKKKSAVLFLAQGESNSLFAVMFGQEQLSGFLSPLLVPNTSTLKFTTLLGSTTPDLPVGAGFGTVRLLSNGLVVGVGKMGDGSKLVWGTTLVSIDESTPGIPVYSEPVRGGSCGGVFVLPDGDEEFQAQLRWLRAPAAKAKQPYPAGFSGTLDGVMATYTPPAKGVTPVDFGIDQTGGVALAGPSINPGVEALVSVQGTRLVPSAPLKSFSINRATGLFSGKMKVGTKTVGFNGAVIQGRGMGRGYYTINKVTGLAAFAAE